MFRGRSRRAPSSVLRNTLVGLALAVAILCWPTALTMPARPTLPTPTAWNLAGIWHTPAMDYSVTLYVQPCESAGFAIRSVTFSWGDRTEDEARVRAIGLGHGPGALLQLDEPVGPFRRAGYFAVHLGGFGDRAANGRIVGVRDHLRICPIPSTLLIEAIRSGRLDGTIVMRAGQWSPEISDSSKTSSFLAAHANLQFCQYARDGSFRGQRIIRTRRPAMRPSV